jgi:hypothetical protein
MQKEESIVRFFIDNQVILSRAPEGLKRSLKHPHRMGMLGRDMSMATVSPPP